MRTRLLLLFPKRTETLCLRGSCGSAPPARLAVCVSRPPLQPDSSGKPISLINMEKFSRHGKQSFHCVPLSSRSKRRATLRFREGQRRRLDSSY